MLNGIHDAVIIYNPAAGGRRAQRRRLLEAACEVLSRAGIRAELQPTQSPGDATTLARRAVAERRQLVIVSGGDGTVNEAVNGLAGSAVPMALLPSGTANVLGKELKLPSNIPRAAATIAASRTRRIALGQVVSDAAPLEKRYFICLGGAGTDGYMIQSVHAHTKMRLGILAYWLAGVKMLFTYGFPFFRVQSSELELEATLLVIGRTRSYGAPVEITTRASLFDDGFEVMASTVNKRYRLFTDLPALVGGRLRETKDIYFWKTKSVRIEPIVGQAHVYPQVDGEIIGPLPLEFHIVPDALTLVVPEGFKG